MNDFIELFIRSIVTGLGAGVGNYFILRLLVNNLEKAVHSRHKTPGDKKQ